MTQNIRLVRLSTALGLVALLVLGFGMNARALAGSGPLISLQPDSGEVGAAVRVTGSGFGENPTAVIRWDGDDVAKAQAVDGSFEASFQVPAAAQGGHKVTVCAYEIEPCDSGEAEAQFTIEVPTDPPPTKRPTDPPKGQPSVLHPTPEPPNPAPPDTQRPDLDATPSLPPDLVEPPPVQIPPDLTLPPAIFDLSSHECPALRVDVGDIRNPIIRISTTEDFESNDPEGRRWLSNGGRAQSPVRSRSGTMAWTVADESLGRNFIRATLDNFYSDVTLYVGRVAPPPNAGPLTVILQAFGYDPAFPDRASSSIGVARTVLEDAAIPVERCLQVVAPRYQWIRGFSIGLLDITGEQSIEAVWVDDVTLGHYSASPPSAAASASPGSSAMPVSSNGSQTIDSGSSTQSPAPMAGAASVAACGTPVLPIGFALMGVAVGVAGTAGSFRYLRRRGT